ncbi:MAG: hypothetical protein JWM48_2568 [Mycobacterium sp.]|nr:hypothetical protein [Mycobacterium sp.]MCW2746018.1 hypothetical protein [Mycobacterium sp.]
MRGGFVRGAPLLLGAAAVSAFCGTALSGLAPAHYVLAYVPLVVGVALLVSALLGGRTGRSWAPGLVITVWGIGAALIAGGRWQVDLTGGYLLALGVGILAAGAAESMGILMTVAEVGRAVVVAGGLLLLQRTYGGLFDHGDFYAVLLALAALWEITHADPI